MIKAIIFDACGVLYIKDEKQYAESWKNLLKKRNYEGDVKLALKAWSRLSIPAKAGKYSFSELVKKLATELKITYSKELEQDILDLKVKNRFSNAGAKETLEFLSKKYKLFVLSDSVLTTIQRIDVLAQLGLAKYFSGIYSSYDIGCLKNDKRSFDYVLERNNLNASEVVFVGHQQHEKEGCQKSKIKFISLDPKVVGDINITNFAELIVNAKSNKTAFTS